MNRNANTIFGFVAAAVLILSGCINNVDTETGGNSNVPDGKCSLTVDSGFSARAAFPSSLAADMVYAAEISYSSSGAKKWLGADSLENSPAVLRNSPSASSEIRFVFCAPEKSAEYTITVFACPAGTSVGSAADVENAAAASGQAEFSLKAGQKALETPVKVSLSPVTNKTVSGNGKVDLPLSFDSALGIVAAKVNVTKDGNSDSSGNNYGFKMEVSGNSAKLSAENAPAGTYLAIMKFNNSTSTEVVVNSAVQQVSVYPGMTTDCWFIDGKKHGTTEADGTFTPSALELTKYDFTELYVCGTDGGGESDGKRSFYVSSNFGSSVPLANDTYDGSMAKPFATVQKAVETIAASGDTTKKYTIYVDGTVEPLYADTDFNDGTFISIIGTTASNLDLTIKGLSADSRAVLNAKQKDRNYGRVLTSKNTSLTLENLKITGGKENYYGGIYIESGNLTLKNCIVTKNESSNGGGGIHFNGENLIVENSEISRNNGDTGGICVAEDSAETEIKNSSIKNNVARSGGGLELAGTSTIEDCEITGNKAESYGGGLILAFNNKSCKIKNSVINNNTAGGSGGGIYMIGGELRLGSGAVIGVKLDPDEAENDILKVATDKKYGNRSTKKLTSDTNTDFDVGAGIFVAGGTVFMYEDSYICRNYTECSGGGVFIKEGGQFFMYGGVVGWNRSNFGGGILCQGRLGIHYSSIICYNKVSTQLVQGFCGRGAGIAVDGENSNAQAAIKDNTKIFGNSAVIGVNSSINTDALGAGIYSSGRLVINGEEIQIYNNKTDSDGAAIGIEGGTAMLSGCKISYNSAGRYGGAIFISSVDQNKDAETSETLAIKENVSIYSNSATDPNSTAGDGGAIYATTNTSNAAGKCCYVIIGEDKNTEGIVIEDNNAKRGGAFYGADNARFVMNAGKVSGNYSTRTDEGGGGGAMFLWGGGSNYSTFTMNGGEIIGNMAKKGGAGGAVHIDHETGGKAAFIMTGGLLSGNKATDENGNGSKLGGAIYVKKGGQIKLGGSAVVAVSEGNDNCNDIWLATGKTITVTDKLTPGNNAAAGNPKYTARITPQTYNVGTSLITAEVGVTLKDEVVKFCVTGNNDSDEWFITTEGNLSKPVAISSLSSSPDFSIYPKLTVSSGDEMNKLSGFVNNDNNMAGTTVTLLNDITLGSDFQKIGNTDKPFSGTFDGNGKTINSGTASLWTIFYQVTGGTIKNLTSSGKFSMSGIVANLSNNGLIENCTNTATVTSDTYSPLGGVCAKMEGSIIDRCVNKGSVNIKKSGTFISLGGICGSATGVIKNSTNYASVVYTEEKSNDSCYIGGILGTTKIDASIDTELYNCINIGDVSGNEDTTSGIGGILGDAYVISCSVKIQNCVNMGKSSKNAIAGKYFGFGDKNKAHIDFTYYLEGSATSDFAWDNPKPKAYSFKKRVDLYMTTELVTIGTLPSNDLIDLLNAWVTANNSSGQQYLEWKIVDGNPALSY